MVALEAMYHDKEMDADLAVICRRPSRSSILMLLHNLGLTHLIRALNFLDKGGVLIVAVALFENNGADLSQ